MEWQQNRNEMTLKANQNWKNHTQTCAMHKEVENLSFNLILTHNIPNQIAFLSLSLSFFSWRLFKNMQKKRMKKNYPKRIKPYALEHYVLEKQCSSAIEQKNIQNCFYFHSKTMAWNGVRMLCSEHFISIFIGRNGLLPSTCLKGKNTKKVPFLSLHKIYISEVKWYKVRHTKISTWMCVCVNVYVKWECFHVK